MVTTITTTAQEDARVAPAYGYYLGLGRNATAQEVKQAVIQSIKKIVRDYERQFYVSSYVPTGDIDPT
jgi:hypothetical protein